jgi:hypothetical protein
MLNEDVKTVIKGIADLGEEVDRSLADGWQWKDSLNFIDELFATPKIVQSFPKAVAVIRAGITAEDRQGYAQYLNDELDILSDRTELIVEGGFKWLLQTEEFFSLFKKPSTNGN